MKLREFRDSKWCKDAARPEAASRLSKQLPIWLRRVKNLGLVAQAEQLWQFFSGGRATGKDKVLVLGALIYLISPFDLIPDAIPVIGWLDDIGVASLVLQYLNTKIASLEEEEIPGTDTDQQHAPASAILQKTATPLGLFADSLPYNVDELRAFVEELGAPEIAGALSELEADWADTLPQVLVAGRYNVGKSTLLNALIGAKCLPIGPTPTTRGLTFVASGNEYTLTSQNALGEITRHKSASELLDKEHPVLCQARQVLLTVPAKILGGDSCFVDTPGLEDPNLEHSSLTLKAAPRADAIVVVLDATILLSAPEWDFLKELLTTDREQKLFLVINKADRLGEVELQNIKMDAEGKVRELGVAPQIFALSGNEALNAILEGRSEDVPRSFVEFRETLESFLRRGAGHQRRRLLRKRLGVLEQGIRSLSEANLLLSGQSEQARAAALDAARAHRASVSDAVELRQAKLNKLLDRIERRCIANFNSFFSDLEMTLFRHIEELSIEQLQQTEKIAFGIRDQTKAFLERELKLIHDELGISASEAMYDLQTVLHGMPFTLHSVTAAPVVKPEQIAPAVVVLSYPFLGMFSWIYLTVGALFGRSAIENVCRGLLESVGIDRLRASLKEQLRPRMIEFQEGASKGLKEHFDELRRITNQQIHSVSTEMLGASAIDNVPPPDAARDDLCRLWLQRLSLPSC